MIRTVLGDIEPEDLGFCDAHDHVLIHGGIGVIKNGDLDISDRDIAVSELSDFRRLGGRAMVDCMPIDCGRDATGLIDVSRRSGVHVIASTGFHTPYYYDDAHWIYSYDEDTIAGLLTTEVDEGMDRFSYGGPVVDRLNAKAGVVKIGTELNHIAPVTHKIIGAVARCHHDTGVPILTHTEHGTMALEQVEHFGALGIAASSILISHVDRNIDPGLHRELAASGAYLIYDGPSRTKYHSVEQVAELIEIAVDAGASERVLLGLDLALRSYRSGYGGAPGFGFLHETFLPLLHARGMDESILRRVTVDNPARALSFAHPDRAAR